MERQVYFDHAATTRPDPRVVEATAPYISEKYGNPLSIYPLGAEARKAVEEAREKLAGLIGGQANGLYFTSSGAEANNMAIKGYALASMGKGRHIVASAIEHQSILNSLKGLERLGWHYDLIPVDEYGVVDPCEVADAIGDDTVLVSVNLANQEIGTIEPIAEIGEVVHEAGAKLHVDAVQAVGHIPVDVGELGADMLSISGHRFYGPKGVGALYVGKGTRVYPLIDGGMQERGRRAGTENVPAIVGIGKASEIAADETWERSARVAEVRDYLHEELFAAVDHVHLNGHPTKRLPTHESVCIEYIEGESMILFLSGEGIYTSSGSTCSSKALKASHVLLALGVDSAIAQGSLQLTLGPDNSKEDVDYCIEKLVPIVERLRRMSPLYPGN
ncbi:MAG: cysteine desulfurase [Candidatus Coatesbacteria bacterium]|nr:MAG: cysteine desulfurase [Candidatus Coatesbacteria bacterium]